ncbi:MAG: hypothetical protein JO100_07755 [Pseudonocardia sp.]|nr:hypothetical protein [Pseudonocardia sp.]
MSTPPRGQGPFEPPRTPPGGYYGYPPPEQPGYPGYPPPYPNYPGQQDYPPPPGYPPPGYPPPGYPPYGPPQPVNDPLIATDIGSWFTQVGRVIRRSFGRLVLLQTVPLLVWGVFTFHFLRKFMLAATSAAAADDQSGGFSQVNGSAQFNGPSVLMSVIDPVTVLLYLLAIVVSALALGASWFVAINDAAARPTSIGDAVAFASTRLLPMVGWGFLANLITAIGFVLLIIPGIYLSIVFAGALVGVVLVERRGIGRGFALVNPRFWPTTGRLLLAFVIAFAYGIILSFATIPITFAIVASGADPIIAVTVAPLMNMVLSLPLTVAFVAVFVVTYAELRFHARGDTPVSAMTLAAELAR